jgi:CxxC motif-containing protein (DUF1111 family)
MMATALLAVSARQTVHIAAVGALLSGPSFAGCGRGANIGAGGTTGGGNDPAPSGSGGFVAGGGGASGTGSSDAGTAGGAGGGSVGTGVPPACVGNAGTAPALPASFVPDCGGCHSAFGAAANPLVPNLFTSTAAGGSVASAAAFLAQVRAPTGGTLMPAFAAAAISDAEIQSIYNYFKAGTPAATATCAGEDGKSSANLGACSGQALTFAPLFVSTTSAAKPISYIDPTTHHLIFRGAGRVRFRHEMEETYAIYHDHYFEDRTFEYILDDSIPAGGTTIGVTFLPDVNQYYSKQKLAGGQQGGADLNIRAWKIYGGVDGNAFATNAGGAANNVLPMGCEADPNAASCNTQRYTFTITRNDREHRAIQMGDQLQIEFGIFAARYDVGNGSHVRNILPLPGGCTLNGPPFTNGCYTQANYYSDSFRYVVGKGTVTPFNQDCTMSVPPEYEGTGQDFPHPYDCSAGGPVAKAIAAGQIKDRSGPDEAGWSGGAATMPYLRWRHDLYYSQMSPNILGENAANFVQGRRLFHTDYSTGKHIEANNDLPDADTAVHANLSGPLFNQVTCEGCHSHNNRGVPPAAGAPFDSVVVKLFGPGKDEHGGPTPDPNYGKQLQPKAIGGAVAEGSAAFQFQTVAGTFDDGTAYTLTKPSTVFTGASGGAPAAYSIRLARPLIGMGLLEAIPEADILAHADPTDCDHDGIKGVPNLVFDPEDGKMHLGRLGWKASKASVRHQVAEALNLDIGVTTSVFPRHDCGANQTACTAADRPTPELADADLDRLVTYMRALAVPPRRDLKDPQVARGEGLFAQMGCVSCHVPNQHTGPAPFVELQDQVIHPYSDLLLHDMGAELSDNSVGEYVATPSMWRTPPLWGIGLCDEVAAGYQKDQTLNPAPNQGPCHYLHDGRAASLLEAVLWHGGEASAVKARVLHLPSADREALVAFLKSL